MNNNLGWGGGGIRHVDFTSEKCLKYAILRIILFYFNFSGCLGLYSYKWSQFIGGTVLVPGQNSVSNSKQLCKTRSNLKPDSLKKLFIKNWGLEM